MYVSPVSPNILIRENTVPPLMWIPIRVVASALPKGHICFSQSPFGESTALFLVQLSQSCKGCQSTYITAPGYSDWSKRKVGEKKNKSSRVFTRISKLELERKILFFLDLVSLKDVKSGPLTAIFWMEKAYLQKQGIKISKREAIVNSRGS